MIQPFEITHGPTSTKYSIWFVASDKKKELQDRARYNATVRIDPWGKLVACECECKAFLFNKNKLCKHICGKDEDGLLDLLLKWGEIEYIPSINGDLK